MSVLVWWCLMALAPHVHSDSIVPLLRAECAASFAVLAPEQAALLSLSAPDVEQLPPIAPPSARSSAPSERRARRVLRSPWTWVIVGSAVIGLSIGAYGLHAARRERTLVGSLSWGS